MKNLCVIREHVSDCNESKVQPLIERSLKEEKQKIREEEDGEEEEGSEANWSSHAFKLVH